MRRVLMAAVVSGGLVTGPAWAEFTKGQELMILSLRSAVLAAQHCPYLLDERRLQSFLSRKGLTRPNMASGPFSALLQDDLAADTLRYQSDTAAACDQAWASFGPDGPLKGLLRRK